MAAGDVKANVISLSGYTGTYIQPPVGEEWIITTLTAIGDGTNSGYAGLTDGTNNSFILWPEHNIGEGDNTYSSFTNGRVFITSTIYLFTINNGPATNAVAYSGVQTK